jgi:hypothetical protein
METRKKVVFLSVAFILALTALVLSVIVTKKPGRTPVRVQKGQPAAKVVPAPGQGAVSNDSDVQALENDLNSINDEDFGTENLSDQNVGL